LPWPFGQAAKQGSGQWFLVEQRASESVGAASEMLPPEASGELMLKGHGAYRVTKSLFRFYIAWIRIVFKSQPWLLFVSISRPKAVSFIYRGNPLCF